MLEKVVTKKIGAKYVPTLTKEELEAIAKNCFRGAPIGSISCKWINCDDIMVSTDLGYEFYLYDFSLSPGHGLYTTKNSTDYYISFMYKKFGQQYLDEYFERKFNVKSLEEKYLQAKKDCEKAINEFKKTYKGGVNYPPLTE